MATAPTSPSNKHLDVIQFEFNCRQYLHQRGLLEIAKTQCDALKPLIIADVERFGLVPTNAEKSRRIDGRDFVATLTTGDGIEVNDAAALELEILLSKARQSKVFPSLFTRRTEYSLVAGAGRIIEHTKWPKRWADEIRNLYGRCFTANKRTPILKVERRADVEAREKEAAEKAAKRDTKVKKAAGMVAALLITAGVLGCCEEKKPAASAAVPRPLVRATDMADGGYSVDVICPAGFTPRFPQQHTSDFTIASGINWAIASTCSEAHGEEGTQIHALMVNATYSELSRPQL